MRIPRTNPTERFGSPMQWSKPSRRVGAGHLLVERGGLCRPVRVGRCGSTAVHDFGSTIGHELFCTFCTMLAKEPELVRLAPCNPAIFPSVRFRCHAKNSTRVLR
jgi:hypothetical protein